MKNINDCKKNNKNRKTKAVGVSIPTYLLDLMKDNSLNRSKYMVMALIEQMKKDKLI